MAINQGELDKSGNVAHMEEMRNVYKILVGKSKGMRQLGRP
jgi:hypothetical protein